MNAGLSWGGKSVPAAGGRAAACEAGFQGEFEPGWIPLTVGSNVLQQRFP
jgi:hypothetical protein